MYAASNPRSIRMALTEDTPVSLHNVAETVPAEWDDDGDRLLRVPEAVGAALNEGARERVRHPTDSELRFVPGDDDATIDVTLSSPEPAQVRVFWGAFQPWQPTEVGPEPETLSLAVPDRLAGLAAGRDDTGRFDPRVCRILFERTPAIAVHDVSGDCRRPAPGELPDRRLLAYGTSITEGAASSATHLDYVSHLARTLEWDVLNFGCSGSAYVDSAMADYLASRADWDVATLALSINMANQGFPVEEFRERAEYFVDQVAAAHPEKPIACLTLFPFHEDVVEGGDPEIGVGYREALREIVEASSRENLLLVEGTDLVDLSGMTADLLHPGDVGMGQLGRRLAERLDATLE